MCNSISLNVLIQSNTKKTTPKRATHQSHTPSNSNHQVEDAAYLLQYMNQAIKVKSNNLAKPKVQGSIWYKHSHCSTYKMYRYWYWVCNKRALAPGSG